MISEPIGQIANDAAGNVSKARARGETHRILLGIPETRRTCLSRLTAWVAVRRGVSSILPRLAHTKVEGRIGYPFPGIRARSTAGDSQSTSCPYTAALRICLCMQLFLTLRLGSVFIASHVGPHARRQTDGLEGVLSSFPVLDVPSCTRRSGQLGRATEHEYEAR